MLIKLRLRKFKKRFFQNFPFSSLFQQACSTACHGPQTVLDPGGPRPAAPQYLISDRNKVGACLSSVLIIKEKKTLPYLLHNQIHKKCSDLCESRCEIFSLNKEDRKFVLR